MSAGPLVVTYPLTGRASRSNCHAGSDGTVAAPTAISTAASQI
jgi:hypothetical protein